MLKQLVITGVAAAGLILSAQASAHQNNNHTARVNNGHSHHQPAPRRAKFNVDKEQRQQANMIRQGINTCQITPKEAKRLRSDQKRINKMEKRMRRDGLQKWERNKLKTILHTARVKINRFTKNAKNCRPTHRNSSHGNHGNNNHAHGNRTWSHSSNGGSFSITIGH